MPNPFSKTTIWIIVGVAIAPHAVTLIHPPRGPGKTRDGRQAIRWWLQARQAQEKGDRETWADRLGSIAHYCCHDVRVTMRVHEYGAKHGHVKYLDRNNREQKIEVNWKV